MPLLGDLDPEQTSDFLQADARRIKLTGRAASSATAVLNRESRSLDHLVPAQQQRLLHREPSAFALFGLIPKEMALAGTNRFMVGWRP